MHVGAQRPLLAGSPEDIGVAGIETFDGRAFVAGGEGRDEVFREVDQGDVAVEGRAVLFVEI